jgi:hypothetical protein
MKTLFSLALGLVLSASVLTSSYACGDETAACKGHKKECCKDKSKCSKDKASNKTMDKTKATVKK